MNLESLVVPKKKIHQFRCRSIEENDRWRFNCKVCGAIGSIHKVSDPKNSWTNVLLEDTSKQHQASFLKYRSGFTLRVQFWWCFSRMHLLRNLLPIYVSHIIGNAPASKEHLDRFPKNSQELENSQKLEKLTKEQVWGLDRKKKFGHLKRQSKKLSRLSQTHVSATSWPS